MVSCHDQAPYRPCWMAKAFNTRRLANSATTARLSQISLPMIVLARVEMRTAPATAIGPDGCSGPVAQEVIVSDGALRERRSRGEHECGHDRPRPQPS